MKKTAKSQQQSKVVNIASRTILGSGLLLLVLDYDMKEAAIQCLQGLFFLLSAHICYIFVEKRRAKMEWEFKENIYIWVFWPLTALPFVPDVGGPLGIDVVIDVHFVTKWLVTIICYSMAKYLKISQNAYETDLLLKSTKYHIGPGLAQANYRFLENVIKGKKKDKGGGHVQLMREYIKDEELHGTGWFCPKVLILFPEWRKENRERIWGSVDDIFKKEKENGSNHMLTHEKITYKFKASGGNDRRCELEVLKNQDEEGNWYAILAENRPLNTLYRMVGEPAIPFKEEDFNQQFHIYMRELRRLLDADEGCRGKYEIFHYKDPGSAGKFNFSREMIKQLKKIRYEEFHGNSSVEEFECSIESDGKIDSDNLHHIQRAIKDGNSGEKETMKEDKKNI